MRRPLDLESVRAAKELRRGADRDDVRSEFGLSEKILERIELAYADAPPDLLGVIERLLDDRQKLQRVISALLGNRGSEERPSQPS
jgi:hypothetical protein